MFSHRKKNGFFGRGKFWRLQTGQCQCGYLPKKNQKIILNFKIIYVQTTWVGVEDELRAPLDGCEEGGRPERRPDVVPPVPEVVGSSAVVHHAKVRRVEVAATGGPALMEQ